MSLKQQEWTGAALYEMAASQFMAARVIQVAAGLDVFTYLATGFISAGELATKLGADRRGLEALLVACTALRLLQKKGDGYRTVPSIANLLVAGRPGNMAPVLAGASAVYRDWVELEQAVQTGQATALPSHAKGSQELRQYVLEMHRSSLPAARFVANAVDLDTPARLYDIGSGAGTFALAFCRRYPRLRATLLDLPQVAAVAQEFLARSDLAQRIRTLGADYHEESFPIGNDVVLLMNVLHQEDEDNVQLLLRKAYSALRQQGTLVVLDAVLNDDKSGPVSVALGALNQLLHHSGGRYYAAAELTSWLKNAGFAKVQRQSVPDMALLIAVKT